MTTFEDKLFALVHGLPVDEPKNVLGCGPSEPGAFAKIHEKLVFDHLMGKTSAPIEDISLQELLAKFTQPRDSRAIAPIPTLRAGDFAKRFGEVIEPQPGGDLAKHAPSENRTNAVRFEKKVIGEDTWQYGYDSAGALVSAYLMNVANLTKDWTGK